MYEEAQLYSPVTTDESGEVTVHLAHDHPGANDPAYRARRNEIAAAALHWSPRQAAPEIAYTDDEQNVWRTVCRELDSKHERYAVREYCEAKRAVGLPTDRIPNLDEVSALLEPISGWGYLPAAGLVPLVEIGWQEKQRPDQGAPSADAEGAAVAASDLLFPLPFNDEQREIVERFQQQSGVVVQGPPGTGKSHTIANLVCHLLATGNRGTNKNGSIKLYNLVFQAGRDRGPPARLIYHARRTALIEVSFVLKDVPLLPEGP